MAPMKDIPNNNFNASSVWIHEKRFWNKELWEIKHVMETTMRLRCILDKKYEKYDLSKVAE